jgi:hypothetical protein
MDRALLNKPVPAADNRPQLRRPEAPRPLTKAEQVAQVSLRHDLPLRDFNVRVEFADGSADTVPVQARDALSAITLVSNTAHRHWPADRLLQIRAVTW